MLYAYCQTCAALNGRELDMAMLEGRRQGICLPGDDAILLLATAFKQVSSYAGCMCSVLQALHRVPQLHGLV